MARDLFTTGDNSRYATTVNRTLVCLLVVLGCRSKDEAPKADPIPPDARKLEIVYEVDLEGAVDDKLLALRRDLVAGLTAGKLDATVHAGIGELRIVPRDPTQREAIAQLVGADHGTMLVPADCSVAAPPTDLCVRLDRAHAERVKRAVLDATVKTIEKRLAKARAAEFRVVARGETIAVRFTANAEGAERNREVIARGGKLAFHIVDNNADYMRRMFAHVGLENDGATDPRARADEIRAEVDQWRAPAGDRQTDYYLFAYDREEEVTPERARQLGCASRDTPIRCLVTGRAVIQRYLDDLAAADPSFRVPEDRTIGYERVVRERDAGDPRPFWRTYYLERESAVTGASVASAKGEIDTYSKHPVVMLEFDKSGAQAFGDLTARIAGKKLATVLDGRIQSAPVVNDPIRGGRAVITMGGGDHERELDDRDALVKILGAGSLPVMIREASVTELR